MSPDFWIKNGISYEKTFVSDDEDQEYEDVDSTSLDDDDAQDNGPTKRRSAEHLSENGVVHFPRNALVDLPNVQTHEND